MFLNSKKRVIVFGIDLYNEIYTKLSYEFILIIK